MLEPLTDLLVSASLPGSVLEDTQVMGEINARLLGSADREEYFQLGGAEYACGGYQLCNNGVVDVTHSSSLPGNEEEGVALTPSFIVRARGCYRSVQSLMSKVKRGAAFLFPPLRLGLPQAVPLSAALTSSRLSSGPERAVAMAFHPSLPLLAVAVSEGAADGSTRVVIINVLADKDSPLASVLTHAFQRNVSSVAWKPFSEDVLAVGCEGGVLVWSLTAGKDKGCLLGEEHRLSGNHPDGSAVPRRFDSSARAKKVIDYNSYEAKCVYYSYPYNMRTIPVTTMDFSHADGRLLLCGSQHHISLSLFDVSLSPTHSDSAFHFCGSIEGGSEQVIFAEDDSYALSLTCGHASISLHRTQRSTPSRDALFAIPFPALSIQHAKGCGYHHYFLQLAGFEGLMLVHVDTSKNQLRTLSIISTSLSRQLRAGGLVRTFACSKRRLWIVLETGHLLICDYQYRNRWQECFPDRLSLIPVGVTPMDATLAAPLEGFSAGSLVGLVENDVLRLIPSYHA